MDGAAQEQMSGRGGRARATVLARAAGRTFGVDRPSDVDLARWSDYVPIGDDAVQYIASRDVLSVRTSMSRVGLDDDAPPERVAKIRASARGDNEPTLGGMYERGGAYSILDESRSEMFLARDYPVATAGTAQVRQGTEYHRNLGATWQLHWGFAVAQVVHGGPQFRAPASFVPWDDNRRALDVDVSALSGRARARAVVGAYLAHRLVPQTTLGADTPTARAVGEVPDVYDGGDFYLRYDPTRDELEAGVFVATPADLLRLTRAGVPPDSLVAALNAGDAGRDQPRRGALAPAFSTPTPHAGGPAPTATRFAWHAPPGAPGRPGAPAPALLYLTQRYAVRDLTPRGLLLAIEPLLDYGTVWRHRWLWRAARMQLGREPLPSEPLQRTPDDYGFDPATESLDGPPPPRGAVGGGRPSSGRSGT